MSAPPHSMSGVPALKHVKSVETAAAVDEMFHCASKPDRHQPTQPLHKLAVPIFLLLLLMQGILQGGLILSSLEQR